ncbi:MAG: flagellar export protein FliJ [Bacteroidetes bacterium]|nr:MAG: flagellar export protein FliJ [Bacteroidota bacterium]
MTSGKAERFDTIVTVREHQKRQTTRELSQIVRQKQAETERLTDLHVEHQEAVASSYTGPRYRASAVQAQHAFIKRLASDIRQQTTKVEDIEGKEQDKRGELIERVKAKNVVETLRDRAKAEVRAEQDKKEQQLLDTLGQRTTEGLE